MTTRNSPPEHGEGTAETSFTEPGSGPVINLNSVKKAFIQKYSEYGKDGIFLTLYVSKGEKVPKGKLVFIGLKGGKTALFTEDGEKR